MKKIGLLIVVIALIFSSCSDDGDGNDPSNSKYGCTDPKSVNYNPDAKEDDGSCLYPEQKVVPWVLEFTSTCCPPCGEWGHETMASLTNTFGNKIVPIAVHTNLNSCTDPMFIGELANSFRNNFPYSGIPSFFIANTKDKSEETINNYLDLNPLASCVFTAVRSGDKYTIKALTQFYDNPNGDFYYGDFYINAFVTENRIDGSESSGSYNQAGNEDDEYYHGHVLRTGARTDNMCGYKIAGGIVPDDTSVINNMTIQLNSNWNKSHLDVVCVIFFRQTGGTKFKFVNANHKN